jgi:Fe(3+) dicitrate transport protein
MSLRLFLAVLFLFPSAAAAQIAGVRGLALPLILQVKRVETTVTVSERIGSGVALEPRLPGGYETVDRTELDRVHAPSVNDALRKVSGVVARDEEGFGLRPNIALRGLNPTRSSKVLLLEDGIPLTFAPYGDNASYYHPPIERFESIEVLKGSGQVAYGPSTVGGVINYLTPTPPSRRRGTLTLSGGNRSFFDGIASFGASRGPAGFFVDGLRKQGDGARDNMHSKLVDANGKLVVAISPAQMLTAKVTYYRERSQVTYSGLTDAEYGADPRQNPFENDAFRGDRAGATLAHHAAPGGRATIASTGYVARFTRHWWRQSSNSAQRPNDSADPACGGMSNLLTTCGNEGRLRSYLSGGVESRVRLGAGRGGDFEFGARAHGEVQDRRQENGAAPTARSGTVVENNERRAQAVAVFAQHRLGWRNVAVTPGVRVEHVEFARTNRLADAGRGVSGDTSLTTVIPGIGLSARLTERAVAFAGIHRGFAPPRVEDVISNTGGLVDLDAELSWNSELGIRTAGPGGTRLDATWFRMAYSNQIVPASLAGGANQRRTDVAPGIRGRGPQGGGCCRVCVRVGRCLRTTGLQLHPGR